MNNHGQVNMTPLNYSKDRPAAANPIKIMDVTLRDGHQSLFATRGRTEDMIPVAEMLDNIGFWALETWGGATFDTMHRFLGEDPWERLRTLKKHITKTPFSMLLRGQNLVGYRNYADDVAKAFVERAAENGMDIFRTFDALNDYRNFETVVPAIKAAGKHFQGCICYTMTQPRLGGEVYSLEYFVQKAKALEELGADSICIKDMAGLIAPYDAYQLIRAIKDAVPNVLLHLHSHCTSGMAAMTHLKAIEAGVDILDTCMSPYANRTSHPAIEPLVMTLLGTDRDTGFDIHALAAINVILERDIVPKYRHLLDDTKLSTIDINVLLHQTPGGMLSNLVNQLREMDALDKLPQVFEELPRVRRELGQIPLVTPTSQIVGTQTVNNVLFDTPEERYKMITAQVKDLCYGLYGKTAIPIDAKVQQKALSDYSRGDEPITCRPAEILEPELEHAKAEIGELAKDIDDAVLYAIYPVTGKKFLKYKYGQEQMPKELQPRSLEEGRKVMADIEKAKAGLLIEKPDAPVKSANARTFNVYVDNEYFQIEVDEEGPTPVVRPVGNAPRRIAKTPRKAGAPAAKAADADAPIDGGIAAPMPGLILRLEKAVGDDITAGETILVLEAMKMENALKATATGKIKSINCDIGDNVKKGDLLVVID